MIINKNDTIPDDETFDNLREYNNTTVRHEIVHAYFHEAGLRHYCKDEKLVDWLALQIPKISKTFKKFEDNQEEFYK